MSPFFRASRNDGHTATCAFTEVVRSASADISLSGAWHGPDDTFGFTGVVNGISRDRCDYLAYGFIVGDGKLTNYQAENILETY